MYGRGGHPIEYWEHAGGGWTAGHIVLVVLLALLAATALVYLVRLLTSHRATGPGQVAAVAGGPATEALAIARLRYARGEIGRDDFLRMTADFGAPAGTMFTTPPSGAAEAPTVETAPAPAEGSGAPPDEPASPAS